MLKIPYGATATYKDVASMSGHPHAARAVGSAMRLNPLPLLIPCHRVVHKSGNKSAYRGGLNMKHYLQDLEKRYK